MLLIAGAAATADLILNVDGVPAPQDVGTIEGLANTREGWMPGGSTGAVALAAAVNTSVRLWHPLPRRADADTATGHLIDRLQAAGVDLDGCPVLESPSVRCLTVISHTGQRLCWSEQLSPEGPRDPHLLTGIDHVVFTPVWRTWASDLLSLARAQGIPVSFVGEIPPPATGPFEWGVADARQYRDARATGIEHTMTIRAATAGSQGAIVTTPDTEFSVPAVPIEVTDTTGAGDVFAGTLMGLLDVGVDPVEAARQASAAAAQQCTHWGALPSPGDRANIRDRKEPDDQFDS